MEYTKNYHLPQWKEDDRIMMRDFNEAMLAIDKYLDEAYKPNKRPYICGEVTVTHTTETGTILATFNFEPSSILISGADSAIILQGRTGTVHTSLINSSNSTHVAGFSLQKNQLMLSKLGANVTYDLTISYIAYQ